MTGFVMSDDPTSVLLALSPVSATVTPANGLAGITLTIRSDMGGMSAVTGVEIGGMQSLVTNIVDDKTMTALVPSLGLGLKTVILKTSVGNITVSGGFTVTL
jgi:hypothetical protein